MATKEEKTGVGTVYVQQGKRIVCWKAWKKEGGKFYTSFGKQVEGNNHIAWAGWMESPNAKTAQKALKKYKAKAAPNMPENGQFKKATPQGKTCGVAIAKGKDNEEKGQDRVPAVLFAETWEIPVMQKNCCGKARFLAFYRLGILGRNHW